MTRPNNYPNGRRYPVPAFEDIQPLTDAQAAQFMAEQQFIRQVEWAVKNQQIPRGDLFA